MLQIGSLVDNKYKILSEIGHGGMSVVYLAINERANKTWAIKEVRKDGVVNFEAVKQGLVVETNMLKRLSHPHLPSIIDVLDYEDSFLIVMDYVEGRSLQSVLKSSGAQPQELVVEWGKQLCDVLGYLHTRQPAIIYRDMKPANVMLKPDGNVMLIDFGTAREFKNRAMVEDTTCLGTRGYAAPEQFGGWGQTDGRTDIYCLGATLYHLLTGHSPAEPPYEIKPLSYWDPTYAGSGMEKLINKCCQQDPSARYQSCEELMYALEHLRDEDDAMIRKRRFRMGAFLASAGLCVLGLLGMLGFGLAANATRVQTYDYFVTGITSSANMEEVRSNCKEALKLRPERREAYDALLNYFMRDSKFEAEEEVELKTLLNMGSSNARERPLESLKNASPKDYSEIEFLIGYLYYFDTDHKEERMQRSASYFAEASQMNNPRLATLAKRLQSLAEGLYKINNPLNLDASLQSYNYRDFWVDMEQLVDEVKDDSFDNPVYKVNIYREVAWQVGKKLKPILDYGVQLNEIGALLGKLEQRIEDMSVGANPALIDEITQARAALTMAQNEYYAKGGA